MPFAVVGELFIFMLGCLLGFVLGVKAPWDEEETKKKNNDDRLNMVAVEDLKSEKKESNNDQG